MTNRLTISEKEFNELYPDLIGLYKRFNDPVPTGTSNAYFEEHYLTSKLWRLNNIYKITDKQGNLITFRMNRAQHVVYARSRLHPRIIILKSRQQGISTLWLVSFFDDAVFGNYMNIGLMAQGTDEASTLLERSKLLWDALSDDIKKFANVALLRDNRQELGFSNNSNIFIRVSFRSTTLQRLHISEFGKIANANPSRAKETKTGTLQALGEGNTGVIESTAEGRNEFKFMWDNAVLALESGQITWKDFYPVFLSWLDDPDCVLATKQTIPIEAARYFSELEKKTDRKLTNEQKWWWVSQYRELVNEIYQEYPATPEEAFAASRDGTYWAKKFKENVIGRKRIITNLHDANLPSDFYFDLGVDDYTVVGGHQYYDKSHRLIYEDFNNGYDLEYYIDNLANWAELNDVFVRYLVFPHDIRVRQLVSGSKSANQGERAQSRLDLIYPYIKERLPKTNVRVIQKSSVIDGIEAVRWLINNLYLDPQCEYLYQCFLNYSKQWDDKLLVWKKTPLENEYCHGADMVRQIAVAMKTPSKSKMETPKVRLIRSDGGFAI